MDFHSMKRKELQALCKKHNIPANLTNLEMANELTSFLKEKEKPTRRGRSCLKNVGEVASENDSDAVTRQVKKVRFSSEDEMFEFGELEAEPVETKRGTRRKSITRPVVKEGFVIENVDSVKPSRGTVENPGRSTRSRAQKFPDGGVIEVVLPLVEAKRKKRVVRSDSMEVKEGVSGVDLSDNLASDGAAVEENRVPTRRSFRDRGVLTSIKIDKDVKDRETVENPVRTTSSQVQKFPDGGEIQVVLPIVETKRTKKGVRCDGMEVKDGVSGDKPAPVVDLSDNLASDSAAVEENIVPTTRSLRNREVLSKEVDKDVAVLGKNQTQRSSKKRNAETIGEISKDNGLAADGGITQPEKAALRRSKRNVGKVEDYTLLNRDLGKNEMVGRGRTTRSQTHLAENGSAAESGVRTETKVEVHRKLEVVLQLEEPSRRPVRNGNRRQSVMPQVEKVGTDGAKLEKENRKLLRRSLLEDGSSSENLEENDVRSRRISRHELLVISDGMDRTTNNTRKIEPRKSGRDPTLEEVSVVTEGVEESPRRSARSAAKTYTAALAVGEAVGRKKLPSRSKPPHLEVELLAKSTLAAKEPPILDGQLSMPEMAETAIDPVLNSRKVPNDITSKKRKEFSRTSLAKEVSAETSDFEEAKALKMANSVDIPASKSVKLQNNYVENEALFSVGGFEVVEKVNNALGVDKEKLLQDNISRINEDDSASHSCKSRDFDSNDLVEPEPVSGDDGYSAVDQTDCVAQPADNLDLGKEMESDEKPTTGKYVDLCCVVPHDGVDDDNASVPEEKNLVELEDGNSFGETVETELDVEGLLAESNETRGSKENSENVCEEARESSVDHSDSKRVIPSKVTHAARDEAEKSSVDAEGQESANCSLRVLNIEVETLLNKKISAFKGPPVSDSVMTELEVAEGASNPALSSSKKVTEDTNTERKWSSGDSSLNKRNHSMGVSTKSPYLNEIRGLIMENLEGTPASNSLKLQSDSAVLERENPASESLVDTEKENIVLVAGNQNLFQDDMLKGDEYGLVSWSQNRIGSGFDSKTSVDLEPVEVVEKDGNVVITESTCRAVNQSPVHQAEYVVESTSILTLSEDLETEKPVSSKYHAAGDEKCSVLEAQNFIEFQEVRKYAEPSTYERVCADHSTGPDETEGPGEDCENDCKKAVDIIALDPSHEERNSPNILEENNNEDEFSDVVSIEVVSEKVRDFQLTSGYCSMRTQLTPLIAPECQAAPIGDLRHSTGCAFSIVNDARKQENTNHVEVNENSNYDTEFYNGVMSSADTFASNTGNKFCSQERIEEALAEMENKAKGVFSVERVLHRVDEEIGHEGLKENSLVNCGFFPILNELNGQPTKEKENTGSDTNSLHNSEENKEKNSSKFTNGKRTSLFISVERDTDPTEDTPAPVNTPKSSLVVNNEIMSSSEHTSLNDVNESGRELKILFATPANNTFPNEETSDHELCQTLSKSNLLMEEQSSEFTESAVNGGAAAEDAQMDVEDLFAETNESGGSKEISENVCKEAVEIGVIERDEAEKSASCSPRMLNIEVETQLSKNISSFKGPPVTDSLLLELEVADCSSNPSLSSSEKTSEDTNIGRKGSSRDSSLKKQHHSMGVTMPDSAGEDDKCSVLEVQRDTDRTEDTCAPIITSESSLVVKNEIMSSSEHTPLKDDNESRQENELKILFATPANNTNPNEEEACSHETECDDVRMQEGSTISNMKNERTNFEEPKEVIGFTENDEKMAHKENASATTSEEITHEGSDGNEDVEVVPELDKSASTALDKLAKRKRDEDLVEISNKFERAVPQVDEMKFNDLTVHSMVQELDKGVFLTSHEFVSAGYEHGEDLEETSGDVAGTMVQGEEMKLDDLESHKDVGIMEGNLNIKDKNTDAEDISPGYSNHYSEHEEVCSPLNVSGQVGESHLYHGDLSSGQEGREVTEVDQVDLFDYCGFTVSSLVPIDCNEDRGKAPTSMDKSFQEDKYGTKEKVVDDVTDNISTDATDGSNIERNAKSCQTLSKEQLVGNEDAVEEDAFVGDISCLASNESKTIPDETDAMHWSLHNFNDMVHCAVDSNEYAEQNISPASTRSKSAVNDDSYSLAAYHGTMGYGASELSLESNTFSSWDLFLGDEVMKSSAGMSETHFTCEGSDVAMASVTKENANAVLSEEQLDKHSHLMEGKVVEPNGSCFVSDENESVEVEKSSVSIHGVILTEVSNDKGSEQVANTVVEDTKSLVEELREAVSKSNSMIKDQSSEFTDPAVDGGTAAEDAQLCQPNSEMDIVENPLAKVEEGDNIAIKQLNSTTMKMKNDRNRLIQGTPKKLTTTLDMKENATSIKGEHVGSISVRSTAKRRALEDLRNK